MPCHLDSCRLRYFSGQLDSAGYFVGNYTPTSKQGSALRPGSVRLPDEASASRLRSQPETRGAGCGLHALRSALYLCTFLASSAESAALMLGHWLRHYIVGLGVVPSHLHVVLFRSTRADDGSVDEIFSLLKRYDVAPHTQVRLLNGMRYTDALKLESINTWLSTLPQDAWAVYADSDEFFAFPCGLADELARRTAAAPKPATPATPIAPAASAAPAILPGPLGCERHAHSGSCEVGGATRARTVPALCSRAHSCV
jgi:hypothetical protein